MKAARLHEYGKPPILEDVSVPDIQPDEILVNVKACGMCRSDVQLIDGYFRKYVDIPTPITLGHEITWLSHPDGAMAPAVIVRSAILTYAPTCVGRDSGRMAETRSLYQSQLAT